MRRKEFCRSEGQAVEISESREEEEMVPMRGHREHKDVWKKDHQNTKNGVPTIHTQTTISTAAPFPLHRHGAGTNIQVLPGLEEARRYTAANLHVHLSA
jgi:hypothetical protein